MYIYIALLVVLLIQIFLSSLVPNKKITILLLGNKYSGVSIKNAIKIVFLMIDFMLLFIVAVFRDESVGQDYWAYIEIFKGFLGLNYENILDNEFANKGEISFVILGYLLNKIFSDYIFLVCVAYIIILLFVYKFIRKYSTDVLLSVFLFVGFSFFNMSLNIMRQYIAAAIVLKSIDYIEKPGKFILCLLIAMTFHKTAILFIIMYPVLKYVNNIRISCLLLLMICAVGAFFSDGLIHMLGDMAHYGDKYTSMGTEAEIDLKIIVNSILFITYFTFSKQFNNADKNANKWIAMSAVTLGLNFTALYFHYVNRMFLYFMLPEIVSLPNFINSFKSNEAKIVMRTIMIVVFSLYYTILVCNTSCYGTVPYTSNVLDIR